MKKRIEPPKEKTKLHPRNKHRLRYDFKLLTNASSSLTPFVKPNEYGDESIDFFNPDAVKELNKALLKVYYGIENWDIPVNYLCPPIPGRADYIHYMADLLASSNNNTLPKSSKVKCLDIGVGTNSVYPIIGNAEYGWSFVGSDIDSVAIASVTKIVAQNPSLKNQLELRLQTNKKDVLKGIIKEREKFDLIICNPPFHSSLEEMQTASSKKISHLKQQIISKPTLNFGGKNNELWCEGGEANFIKIMIKQSVAFKTNCLWFSCLLSKQSNLKNTFKELRKVSAIEVKTISMGQGNKISRIVAWSFLTPEQQTSWLQEIRF